ncbi:MAG: endolytic transglycosylase MltG [Clostridiales bacterium]|nr:endolytic transglycosylase MltG [Clostridiales bacterium]
MGKLKDILYDISDILTAFCIVGIAGLVIWCSIGNIMDYPSIVSAAQQDKKNTNFGLAVPVGDSTTGGAVTTNGALDSETGDSEYPFSIYINYGESTASIAEKFVNIGLFDSVEQFNTLLEQKNAASSIKSGNFIIPANSTPEEVIAKITTTPSV